jgi:dTDP-4-dehydro-6-deoxy-alpha-D-glucopyranose 2,3-dehydratase
LSERRVLFQKGTSKINLKGIHIMTKKKVEVRLHNTPAGNTMAAFLPGLSPEDCRLVLRSRTIKASLHSDRYLDRWLKTQLLAPRLNVTTISLQDLAGWSVSPETGDISHDSGKFFSIIGADVRHRTKNGEITWDQPVIDQPEVGILGILAMRIKGVLHFCLQVKEEPGNINSVQLSPTVQATYSNYTRVHGGALPKFIHYFLDSSRGRIIYAKLQTEDGGRFLYKSNRNMIVEVDAPDLEELPEGFIWVTLRQIGRMLRSENLVHACTRSILSALISPECTSSTKSATVGYDAQKAEESNAGEIFQWLDDQKSSNHFLVKRRSLNSLKEWSMDRDGSFSHEEGRFFRVVGINVESSEREVAIWNQPILDNPGRGIVGLLIKVEKGRRYFLMQAKAEFGNRGIIQIGPTVQFTPGNYIRNKKLPKPFLFEEFCKPEKYLLKYDSLQSEEGARFYKEAHLHRILLLEEGESLQIPQEYKWISESDLHLFINIGEMVNSCARSVFSLMLSHESAA